ncbi:hypothetical protein [Micromonospora sp. NPDC049033]|uniref:hypothetical protein n=1 Tax=Micromonospora sp. NPDC049033 TaxID=3155149 RepID=UPI0033E3656B
MRIDPSRFTVGDEWAYRQSDHAPSERVRILAVEPKKTSARLEIRFLDDPDERVEKIPGSRLRVPWNEVGTFDALMANWQRIDDLSLDHTEEACVEEIFGLLISEDVAELLWSPVSCTTDIHDRARLSEIIDGPVDDILASAQQSFPRSGELARSSALRSCSATGRGHNPGIVGDESD